MTLHELRGHALEAAIRIVGQRGSVEEVLQAATEIGAFLEPDATWRSGTPPASSEAGLEAALLALPYDLAAAVRRDAARCCNSARLAMLDRLGVAVDA